MEPQERRADPVSLALVVLMWFALFLATCWLTYERWFGPVYSDFYDFPALVIVFLWGAVVVFPLAVILPKYTLYRKMNK